MEGRERWDLRGFKMKTIICDRCGKICAVEDATNWRLGVDYYFDLCEDCKLWLLHELHVKEEFEKKGGEQ